MSAAWAWAGAIRGCPASALALAALAGLMLGAVALSFLALTRAKAAAQFASRRIHTAGEQYDAALAEHSRTLQELASNLGELRARIEAVPGPPRPAFNLSKRSQALRMYRRGDSTEQIATALDIPRQEVDLLVKVHRIVISNV